MARDWEPVTGQSARGEKPERPARHRRLLRRGPRLQAPRARPARMGEGAPGGQAPDTQAARALIEWHDMTPGEQVTAWAELRAWVTWLHDRYELSVEDRLPRCWARHPGLVEELAALKAWREEIYGSGQPSGQAALYWHNELRQVLHAASSMYALGCRTGHRAGTRHAASDPDLLADWAAADPLDGVPGIDIAAGRARRTSGLATSAAVAAALDSGEALPLPGSSDHLMWVGGWWAPASAGWVQVPGRQRPGLLPGPPARRPGPPIVGMTTEGVEADPWAPT
jgi:hypothetical protein